MYYFCNMIIELFSIVGFVLSVYAFKVENKLKTNKKYHAICDLNNKVSCSKTFMSKYGHLAGFSNSLGGIFFYLLIFILAIYSVDNLIFYLSLLGFLGTVFLAYLSFIQLKTYCPVCTLIYILNILLLVFSYIRI